MSSRLSIFSGSECKLSDIMTEQKKAPITWDNIPPSEMWRYVSDGFRFSISRNIKNFLLSTGINTERFNTLNCEEALALAHRYNTDQAILLDLALQKEGISEDLHQTTNFAKFIIQQDALLAFQRAEPGYFRAILPALSQIKEISLDEKPEIFSKKMLENILHLHSMVVDNVANLTSDIGKTQTGTERKEEKRKDIFRSSSLFSFLLLPQYTVSKKGFDELLKAMQTNKDKDTFFYIELTNALENKVIIIINDEEDMKHPRLASFLNNNKFLFVTAKSAEEADYYKRLTNGTLAGSVYNLTRTHTKTDLTEKVLTEQLMEYAKEYQAEMKAIPPEAHAQKLEAIVKLIQKCELFHPFQDANTRLFSMVLLNHLLITNNFPPTIQNNPNQNMAFSIQETVSNAIAGMARTIVLAQNATLPDELPTEAILANCSDRRFFDEDVAMETARRKTKGLLPF